MKGRTVWAVLCLVAAAGFASQPARAQVKAEENIVFDFVDISENHPNALRLIKDMVDGRRIVRKWWGASFEGTIRVIVSDEHRIQTSLVPGWRGNRGHYLLNTRRVTNYSATTIHNLIHIYAPNGNRMLAEGLAVYAHNHLGGPPGWPDYGKDLHILAAGYVDAFDLVQMDRRSRTPRPLPRPQEEAYIVAGSFVKFLIEALGMEKFRELYAATPFVPGERIRSSPRRWNRIYGNPLTDLIAQWKQVVEAREPKEQSDEESERE